MNVLLIVSTTRNGNTKIKEAFEKRGHSCNMVKVQNLSLSTAEGSKHDLVYERTIDDDGDTVTKKIPFSSVDAVVTRMGKYLLHGSELLAFIQDKYPKIYLSQSPTGLIKGQSKLKTARILRIAKIATPAIFYSYDFPDPEKIQDRIGFPCILKTAYGGSQGREVIMVNSPEELDKLLAVDRLKKREPTPLLLQKLINVSKPVKDIRVLCFNRKVIAAMERTAANDSYKSNISLGAVGKEVELTKQEKNICLKSCEVLGLQIGAVDMMRDVDGNPYVIEVNTNYGVKIQKVVDPDIHKELVISIEEHLEQAKKGKRSINDFTGEISELIESGKKFRRWQKLNEHIDDIAGHEGHTGLELLKELNKGPSFNPIELLELEAMKRGSIPVSDKVVNAFTRRYDVTWD